MPNQSAVQFESATLSLARALIRQPSITPEDLDCQAIMIERLKKVGFTIHALPFGDVDNFWATRGSGGPILCFAGHTDVVPVGDINAWQYPPFEAKVVDDVLHGRGAADMKGSLAAMLTATEAFVESHPRHSGTLAFLITSDEEGIAKDGTVKVVEWLKSQQITPDWCIVGEPSSTKTTGDVIKNGRRGSLGAVLTVKGIQGHVAYPQLADNPIHRTTPALAELAAESWDNGNDFFPATSFQISNINGGTGATNVIPGELKVVFNFRYSTETNDQELIARTCAILDKHQLNYHIDWTLNGLPFLTAEGDLVDAVKASIESATGNETILSTAGGTSDGRFIAPLGTQVVEIGPVNATIHKVDEQVCASELDTLKDIYHGIMERLLR